MLWTRNDPPLRDLDRFTAASLSEDERRLQRNVRRIKRIEQRLGPQGKASLTLAYSELPDVGEGAALLYPWFGLSGERSARAEGAMASFPMPLLPLRIGRGADDG